MAAIFLSLVENRRSWYVSLGSVFVGVMILMAGHVGAANPDQRVYEMRVYYAAEGKLEALNARFRDHTLKLFEKHGMINVGYWTPVENPERQLIYFLAYPSRESRETSWKSFLADPDWQAAYKQSEVNGKLVAKVDMKFLQATDYSPAIEPIAQGDRVFELRTYTTTTGNLDALHARFRDHTVGLFAKHGMTNVAYWKLMDDQDGAKETLIYIMAHKSVAAAGSSFDAFRQDPEWVAARTASEEKAGGSLTAKDGVKSVFLQATDYSPIR
ncbi:MAG: NIPSNAP family protein [Planctomycetota bacterium]|nr:NIPSNAP family protein [Planctomycetota bacterium]